MLLCLAMVQTVFTSNTAKVDEQNEIGPAALTRPGPGTKEVALMHPKSDTHNGLLDAVAKVQTAVEKTSTQTKPVKYVVQTLNRPTGAKQKGKKYPATPPSNNDTQAILDCIFTPEIHGRMKWAAKWGTVRLRNRALVVTMWRTGLRIHEALLLKPIDIDFENCTVTVQRGKGGKRRISGIDRPALAEINSWLHVRSLLGLGLEEYTFCVLEGPTKGGLLSQSYVRVKLHEARKEAGVLHRVAPHQLRHALAVDLARNNTPIPLISRQLGHSNVSTTATYLAGISPEEVIAVMSARIW